MNPIRIDQIRFDAETQVRTKIDEAVVANYAEAMTSGTVFPAVIVFHDGSSHYLADGFHRTLAAKRVGFTTIDADVQKGTKEDALWFALGANKHGQPLTTADKRHAIILALKTWPDKSQTQIADQIGCTQRWVSTIKDEVRTTSNLPARVTGKDGKSYPASRSAKESVVKEEAPLPDIRDKAGKRLPEASIRSRERAKEMAESGYTTRQIAAELGIGTEAVTTKLKSMGIEATADRYAGRTHHIDHNRLMEQIVAEVESAADSIKLLDLSRISKAEVPSWIDRLASSSKALAQMVRQLKETHV